MGMTARSWLDCFLCEFHSAHMKPMGFKKSSHTFTRQHDGFRELVNFQGSRFNSPEVSPWRFHINVGVIFDDLETPAFSMGIAGSHWASRPNIMLDGMPLYWEFDAQTDGERLAGEIADVITRCSGKMLSDIELIRQTCIEKHGTVREED